MLIPVLALGDSSFANFSKYIWKSQTILCCLKLRIFKGRQSDSFELEDSEPFQLFFLVGDFAFSRLTIDFEKELRSFLRKTNKD